MKELIEFRNALDHSIETYGKETVSADELLEALDAVIRAIRESGNEQAS